MSIKRLAVIVAALLVTVPIVSGLATAAPTPTSKEVVVVNDVTQPVPVTVQENVAELRVEHGKIDIENDRIGFSETIEVPAGKIFVVEHVTVEGYDFDESVEELVERVILYDQGPPGSQFLALPIHRNAPGHFAASEQVLYAEDGPFLIRVELDRISNGFWALPWTVSGYMVDA